MPTGFTTITASHIQDASGQPLASGRVTFYPVNSSGGPVSAIAGGGGGPILESGVVFLVVSGGITTDLFGRTPMVADTTLTTPVNIAYRVTITDASGVDVQGPGYGLVQPSGSAWSLDTYTPVQPLNVTVQAGPAGPPGPPGSGSGIVLVDPSTSAGFTLALISGRLEVVPTAPVLIDTVTSTQYALQVTGGRLSVVETSGAINPVNSVSITDAVTGTAHLLTVASGRLTVT